MPDAKEVRPGAFRVKIQPAPEEVKEDNAPFRATLPAHGPKPDRGIIVMVGPGVIEDSSDSDRWGFIKEGAVVFYKGGYILGGYVFLQVDADSIIAYED